MSANFPGAGNAVPGSYVDVQTLITGVAVPAGTRLALIMGEGAREEVLIASAAGGGLDGFNPDFSGANAPDGRHFLLGRGEEAVAPVVINRTSLEKNGIPLTILEQPINNMPFDNRFDARVDPQTGQIELQGASLVDQGGDFWRAAAANVGNGVINNLSLIDQNAPSETWTIRCSSVRRDGYGNPIDGYARFIARGTVSGTILDGYGNQIVWQSDNEIVDNTILRFSIDEGSIPFREGDSFVVQVQSQQLAEGDNLVAQYIPVIDINDIEFFTELDQVVSKHGRPSLANRLSLGAQLAFANGAPGVFCLECAPSIPRRISYTLVTSANGQSDFEELSFPLPLNVVPDSDTNINFFFTDPVTGVETQVIPNKVPFYDPTITSNPQGFVFGPDQFSYTVILDDSVQKSGNDGVITPTGPTTATLASSSVQFGLDDLTPTRSVTIVNALNPSNNGSFGIVSIANGLLTLSNPSGFVAESGIEFQVRDSIATTAFILFTQDLALTLGESLRATVVDTRDANFFDVGWISAYSAAETVDIDILVPLPSQTITAIFANGLIHVESQSNIKNRRERVLFIGAIQGLTPANVIGTEPAAVEDIGVLEGIQGDDPLEILNGDNEDLTDYGVQNAYGNSFRVVYFYPDRIVVQVGADRVFADGFFMAAAAAGFLSGIPLIAEPITNKVISGFTILRDKLFPPITIENLAASGIVVVQPVAGGGRVIWGKTTTTSNFPEEEESSIVFIRDRIAKSLRAAFAPFIGRAETPTFTSTLFAIANSQAQSFLSQRLITDFRNIVVERDPIEPRQFNVSMQVQPVFPVNWIFIRVEVGRLDV